VDGVGSLRVIRRLLVIGLLGRELEAAGLRPVLIR